MTGKLGAILIAQGVIDEEKLIAALSDQRAFGGKLGRTLVDLGYVSEGQLVAALAEQLGLGSVDLEAAAVAEDALSCLPVDACERYGVFPFKVDRARRMLWVATAEPDRQVLQEVAQIAQLTVEPVLAPMSAIDRAVRRSYFGEGEGAPAQKLGEPLKAIPGDAPQAPPAVLAAKASPAAVVDPAYVIGAVAPQAASQDAVQELKTLLVRLEKTVNAQSRAFRALVDLLQDKGVVRRGELGARAAKK